jgi:hypothetical protein
MLINRVTDHTNFKLVVKLQKFKKDFTDRTQNKLMISKYRTRFRNKL